MQKLVYAVRWVFFWFVGEQRTVIESKNGDLDGLASLMSWAREGRSCV